MTILHLAKRKARTALDRLGFLKTAATPIAAPGPGAPALLPNALPAFARKIAARADAEAASGDAAATMKILRTLGLDDFGLLLMQTPNPDYPNLAKLLPAMASVSVQENWTGASGLTLLKLSLNFARVAQSRYADLAGKSLRGATILDYGCGYGRILRLMQYFADDASLFGCDPWDESIALCRNAGLRCRLDLTDYLPAALPYDPQQFDFIFAFSVFTHTSLRASTAALSAIRRCIKPDGVFAMTIRPVEYWDHHAGLAGEERERLKEEHDRKGFAFRPHPRQAVDGDITYGDTSMTFDFLREIATGWSIAAYERTLDDSLQVIVFLKPA